MHAHLNYRMLHVPTVLIILIYGVFFDKILHHSKNIVKSRMNMELHAATVFLTMGSKT